MPDQKHQCSASSVEYIEMIDDDVNVMGGKTWCFMYDPETKRQSETWSSAKKTKAQRD
jgi:hypothetical protein